MPQTTIKVSPAVHRELKAYADAHGGLALGRAVETLLVADRERQFWAGVNTQVPDEEYRQEVHNVVGLVDAEDHMSRLESREQ
ncbi:hypothetical protein APR04_001693 [Promicromonospora umidemergens]|uniref:Uncharacterized protein n=1 Tax=Promicromonospora umidemergens TaxID=629679 RepID=A0ABP8XF18_9MICO|nr:DUF2274 domain-containing protein [Promicromonospora umidemergens]MCP2282790.1 hypothetical protein [Promicromonospora umidemergens]